MPVPNAGTSFDYDISYLDALYLPVALEADTGTLPGVGYVGTTLSLAEFEASVNAFASGTWLEGYLGTGKSWPQYYLSNPTGPNMQSKRSCEDPGGPQYLRRECQRKQLRRPAQHLDLQPGDREPPEHRRQLRGQRDDQPLVRRAKYYQQNNPGATPTPVLQMLMSQPNVQTFPIETEPGNPGDLALANAFSQLVWEVMNEFSTDP